MPKSKRVAKKINKKVIKRKITKHNNNNNDTSKNAAKPMTKLEYEQALTDPRFRAAMQGFNNPMSNAQQYMNHSLHEQEVKNNELTREIAFQNDLANAKQANMKLKDELSTAKLQHKEEITAKQLELENQRYKYEMDTMQKKHDYDEQISKLNTALANEKQQYADAQARWKQKQEKQRFKRQLLFVVMQHCVMW